MRTSEVETIQKDYLNGDAYLRNRIDNFKPIFVTDVQTLKEAPVIIAELLGVPLDTAIEVVNKKLKSQSSGKRKKWTREEEKILVQEAGATEIYQTLEKQMQQKIKQNYLYYGMRFLCNDT